MKIILFLVLFISISIEAQNLDSLLNSFMHLKNQPTASNQVAFAENNISNKCGFETVAAIRRNLDKFDKQDQVLIKKLLERPNLHTSIVSPSGYFRIHFDTVGTDIPKYDVNELAVAFDSVYNFEVNILGYLEPPSDGILGGDDKYDIYISGRATSDYGFTDDEVSIGNNKYISNIVMHNSFEGNFFTSGIAAAKVTAAHEFHHAIQIGNYIFNWDDVFYHELTSTAFEEFVFDDVNDYYGYMGSYFNSPSKSIMDQTGYNSAIWNIFLQERFYDEDPMLGHKIIKRSWELMEEPNGDRATVAIAKALNDYDKQFSKVYNTFGDWLYFTNENSKNGEYFDEAENYPLVRTTFKLDLDNSTQSVKIESEPTSFNFVEFTDNSQGFADTIVAVLSNSDVYGALSSSSTADIELTLSNSSFSGGLPINDVYYSKISGQSSEFVQSSFIINNELADNQTPRTSISFAYPQPFNYTLNVPISIPVHPDLSNMADLNIYSSDMNLVYSGKQNIFSNGNIVVKWDGYDNNKNQLASGVYIFVTKADGKIKKGKLVILN